MMPDPLSPDGFSQEPADMILRVANLGKRYNLYNNPKDRLKQAIWRKRQYYRPFWALRGVAFEVKRGEAVGIIGRNGAGKSTLLQLIAGTIPPSEGEVTVRGRVAALLELGSGFDQEATGRENVYLAGGIYGFSRKEMSRRFDEIAAFADIGQFLDQPLKFYSSGMFSRLAFALQTHVDPDLLILDEILAVGDIKFQQKCINRIRGMCERGMSLLFVSHSIGHIQALCDWALLLEGGSVIARGTTDYIWDVYHRRMFEEDAAALQQQAPAPTAALTPAGQAEQRYFLVANREAPSSAEVSESDAPALRYREREAFLARVERTRFGTGEVRIVNTELIDPSGMPIETAHLNQPLSYRVHLRVDRPISSLIVGFQIKDNRGQCTFSTETDAEQIAFPPLEPGDTVVCEFSFSADFFPQQYTITPGCCSAEAKRAAAAVYYDWIEACDSFRVAMPRNKAIYSLFYRPIPIIAVVDKSTTGPTSAEATSP
jgi:lipopolysaccharide transport system ATP-binding protein